MFKKQHRIYSESQLIELAKKDQAHFGLLYEKYFDQIFCFVFKRLGGDEETSSDLTQQTFLKAMANMDKYKDIGLPFSSWLYRIAQNEVSMYFRNSKKTISVSIDYDSINFLLDDVDDSTGMTLEDQQRLVKKLNELAPDQVDLIELRYFQGISFKEIAEIYNITEANAKMKIYRILEKLKNNWNKEK